MRSITVLSMVSLDGTMQSPGAANEDASNGFENGGWTSQYSDETYSKIVKNELGQPVDYLLGRKTFEIWENYWPCHGDFWPRINEGKKYVLSSTRSETSWNNTIFFKDPLEIFELRQSDGPNFQVWGSGELVQQLLRHDLVDEIRIKIHPIVVGNGKKLFHNTIGPKKFALVDSTFTSTGVIISHYKRVKY